MVIFWAKVKSNSFHVKQLCLLFGKLLEKFGLLLIKHLVARVACVKLTCFKRDVRRRQLHRLVH